LISKNRKPIKTEYCGVVFDSKSEAVFARCLNLAGHEWIYHPREHCGHEWDFLVFPRNYIFYRQTVRVGGEYYHSKSEAGFLLLKPMLVEYKPSMPTNTYVDNLTESMRQDPFESIVVWGNPWEGNDKSIDGPHDCCYRVYPIFSSCAKYGWGSCRNLISKMLQITPEITEEAKYYRFDLWSEIPLIQRS
jgi:hypothetical protein